MVVFSLDPTLVLTPGAGRAWGMIVVYSIRAADVWITVKSGSSPGPLEKGRTEHLPAIGYPESKRTVVTGRVHLANARCRPASLHSLSQSPSFNNRTVTTWGSLSGSASHDCCHMNNVLSARTL